MKIDGKKIADEIINDLIKKDKPQKSLVAVLVGEHRESISFLNQKNKVAERLGINFIIKKTENIEKEIKKVSKSNNTGGIILQFPIPKELNEENIIKLIPKNLDVDALNSDGAKVLSPSVEVVKEILKITHRDLQNSKVAILGFGRLVGKPISKWLNGKCENLYIIDIGDDIRDIEKADIVISGVGSPGIIDSGLLKDGAGVIDFGYSNKDGKLYGDLDLKGDLSRISFYTATPGGTGPILVSKLFENFYKLCDL